MAESQMLIGKELSNMLMREYNVDPQKTWHCVVSILRCLPWRVDPEKAYVESQDGIVDAIYRYFGGMQFTEMDSIFNDLRIMADDGKPWKDIVKYACENIPRKV